MDVGTDRFIQNHENNTRGLGFVTANIIPAWYISVLSILRWIIYVFVAYQYSRQRYISTRFNSFGMQTAFFDLNSFPLDKLPAISQNTYSNAFFREWDILYFDSNFIGVHSLKFNWQLASIGSGNAWRLTGDKPLPGAILAQFSEINMRYHGEMSWRTCPFNPAVHDNVNKTNMHVYTKSRYNELEVSRWWKIVPIFDTASVKDIVIVLDYGLSHIRVPAII